ncbi:hypothetical protein BGZ49_009626 [Haplosporangium sp. Z 27]|nr:hypothetical protein BGZ49_009626 [Haplosporangium sp. Z 27]
MQFNQQGSDDLLPRVPSPTATALEPEKVVSISITSPTEGSIQPTSSFVHEELVHDGTSSLRVKFKNKVNTTLASMKSSSNLRDKFKTQSQDSQESSTTITPRHRSPMTTERPLSTIVTSSTSNTANHQRQHDYTESNGKNRNSKTFWTFPRIRPETNQSSKPQISWGPDSDIPAVKLTQDTDMPLSEPEPVDDGTSTLHKQLEELKVEEPDSDNSLDIILPVDYEDYTQFAELPLKKRKKMERSLAAASESTRQGLNKRPSSIRLSTGAMKKFLKHESTKSKGEGEDDLNGVSNIQSREINPINVNKKRPQLSTESDNSSRRSGLQTAEWRRSFMKTLHLGKAQSNTSKVDNPESNVKSPTLVTTTITTATETPNLEELPVTEVITTRFSRSNTVRSRSLSNATHPALLAAAIAKPRSPGLRRETLEMAMRRRRQSSVARSNISDTEAPPLPFSSEFFNGENISTTNITHTFTSFTLELAEMFAHDVVNNSSVPGLFNFKRRAPRLTVSSNVMELDTDQEFKAFDSDAISGYTGDADMSMEEASAGSPKWPATPRRDSDLFKTRVREASFAVTSPGRRKMSSIDGDSDTVPELPTLTIRTRDLNRSSGGRLSGGYSRNSRPISGSSFDLENDQILNGPESPRSPRRAGGSSPMTLRKSTRSIMQGSTSPTSASNPSSPTKMTHRPMSIEEITSWKPKSASPQQLRPQVPTLDTKPLKLSRGNGASATTTLILPSSSRTPYAQITQSPALMSPGSDEDEAFLTRHYHHQSTSSSSSSRYPQHLHQISGDTLVPSHLRYTSTTSNMSAGSGYSAQTLSGYHPRQGSSSSNMAHLYNMTEAQEFDPSQDFSPTTPADLKAMDFEALLATAEQEQQKGWEDLMAYKKTTNSAARPSTATVSTRATTTQKLSSPQRQQQSHQPDVPPLKIASSKNNRSNQQYQQRGSLVFDLGPSDDGTGTGTGTGTGSDRSMRSKRVMKKKMSVIRLAGNVQGRREDDGVIRVSLSPTPYSSSNIAPSENVPNKW